MTLLLVAFMLYIKASWVPYEQNFIHWKTILISSQEFTYSIQVTFHIAYNGAYKWNLKRQEQNQRYEMRKTLCTHKNVN
jgi:hypothetical protein